MAIGRTAHVHRAYDSQVIQPDTLCKPLAFCILEPALTVTKTEVISVRVPPDVKAALVAAAEHERRSVASMVEFMVLDYCRSHGIVPSRPAKATPVRKAP